ncbi:sterile alpha motif domain-containing protein 15 [Perognathus longimembris pacificus]|uniref:sterile alpha motif domain-containing protein 15 n=1 Tax=Perognathus longimembris pacificus TaxID=214514 RepID=UPI002019E5AA|nr:sterile alpha motif domain-containing protein 15 [Perognathus longimembris pacificus]
MSEVSGDYDSNPDEDEYPLFERFKRPRLSTMYEIVEIEAMERADPQHSSETGPKPGSPESEEEGWEEQESASVKDVQRKPTWTPEDEPRGEKELDLSTPAKPGSPQEWKPETPRQPNDDTYENETYENETYEQAHIDPLAEVNLDNTEYELTELATEIRGPEATIGESRLESPEQTIQEFTEKLLEDQYEEIGLEPSKKITPGFPSEKLRKSVEEKVQPRKMTKEEIGKETRKDSIVKKSTELYEQTKPEFPDQRPRKSTEEADLESPEETKSRVPEQKPGDSTKEEVSESLEKIKPELSGEKSRKSLDKTEVPKKTRRKSYYKEKSTGPPEEAVSQEMKTDAQKRRQRKSSEGTKPTDQKEKQRKSSEIGQATPEKFKLEETLKESTEEKGQELPEETKSEFPKEDSRKSTDYQIPPQMAKPEFQEKTQVENNLRLSGEAKTREKHAEFSQDSSSKQIKSDSSVDKDEPARPEYQKRKMSTFKKGHALRSSKDSEIESVSMDDSDSSPELQTLLSFISSEYLQFYHSESEDEGEASSSKIGSSQELEQLVNKGYPFEQINDFDFLTWSPETVADWIGYLGFPQYKECFTTNFISGRKLIHVNCSNLPQMGITDFEDMQIISSHVRDLLKIEEPLFSRSIRLPRRDNIGLFLEQKSHTGVKSDSLTFSEFVKAAGLQDCGPPATTSQENQDITKMSPRGKASHLA